MASSNFDRMGSELLRERQCNLSSSDSSIPSHFPFGAHLAHSLPTRVAKALGSKAILGGAQIRMRVMAAAARAKISRATKARWAKFRAEKNKKAKAA
jgi:hypothetical protein